MARHLQSLLLRLSGFQVRMAANIEMGFIERFSWPIMSIYNLTVARREGKGDAMNEVMAPPQETMETLKVSLKDTALV